MTKLLFDTNEWTFPRIEKVLDACAEIAFDELKLDCYPNQIEMISSDQMLDAYSTIGLPVMYNHWSFGKSLIQNEKAYYSGRMGLAYEIVINTSPAISYLMEENSMTMQTLVIAHAAFGHNHFFKNNYLFKEWTDADAIVDYLVFAKNYISECEERYGYAEVEEILDSCHALMQHGVDKYKRPRKVSMRAEAEKQRRRQDNVDRAAHEFWDRIIKTEEKEVEEQSSINPEENILYFIEKNSPVLKPWQRELVRIVRKISQYLYPQAQSKVANEGFASFTHYYIMNRLWEKGQINDGSMFEFLHSHTSVVFQPPYDSPYYNGFNPYALGIAIFDDIKRICEDPTDEDKEWFPNLVGKNWLDEILYAVENFKDESFILQYLSPRLMRKWRMFNIVDKQDEEVYRIGKIHDERGYKKIRKSLANQYNVVNFSPDIQIVDVDFSGNRTLKLQHRQYGKVIDSKSAIETMKHLRRLWGYKVYLESVDDKTENLVFQTAIS